MGAKSIPTVPQEPADFHHEVDYEATNVAKVEAHANEIKIACHEI